MIDPLRPLHGTCFTLIFVMVCLTFVSCTDTNRRDDPLAGKWTTSTVQLEFKPDGSVTSIANVYRSQGTYQYVGRSRKKAIARKIGRTEDPLELILLSPNTLQIKSPRIVGERISDRFFETMILNRVEP